MKIGIIGLLPEQIFLLRAEYPKHSLEFLDREREREAGAFAARCSKVVLMTKFISHSVQSSVPLHKRVHISGGMTKLRNWLNTQASEVTTVVHKPAVQKETAVMVQHHDKPIDYSVLKTLDVGGSARFKRPTHTTLKKFEANVNATRSYYSTKHGIKTKVVFGDGYAELTVTELKGKKPAKASAAATETVAPVQVSTGDRQFWQEVLVARLRLGYVLELAARDADEALALSQKRFG